MAKKRKAQKPQATIPVDPSATVFQPGDEIEVLRRPLWSGYRGTVESVDGGMCRVVLRGLTFPCGFKDPHTFHADIPASELKILL